MTTFAIQPGVLFASLVPDPVVHSSDPRSPGIILQGETVRFRIVIKDFRNLLSDELGTVAQQERGLCIYRICAIEFVGVVIHGLAGSFV